MYGLASDTDLTFLQGKDLIQVRIGVHEVIVAFDNDITIMIQSDIVHKIGNDIAACYRLPVSAMPALVRFLGTRVVTTTISPPGTLGLVFSNGETLELHDSSSQYESYHISHKAGLIVV